MYMYIYVVQQSRSFWTGNQYSWQPPWLRVDENYKDTGGLGGLLLTLLWFFLPPHPPSRRTLAGHLIAYAGNDADREGQT